MHAKYQRRVPHLERALLVKRTPADPSGFMLTGPITITVTKTASADSLDLDTATTSSTKSTEASVTSTSSFPTSTTTFFVKVTQTPPPPTQIPLSSTAVPSPSIIAQDAALNTPQPLSSGAIAGVVITCLFVLVAAVIFGMRRRCVYHRMRLRGMWATSKAIGIPPTSPFEPQEYPGTIRPYPFPVPSSSAGNNRNNDRFLSVPSSPGAYFAGAQAASRQAAQGPSMSSVLAPPASYGTGFGSQIPITTPNSPFTSLFPFGATVICTFITSLPDELSIRVGETIRVLAEYDDGWALSLNARGEQGMVPLQCLDRGVGSGRGFDGDVDMDGMRRVSSLNALRR